MASIFDNLNPAVAGVAAAVTGMFAGWRLHETLTVTKAQKVAAEYARRTAARRAAVEQLRQRIEGRNEAATTAYEIRNRGEVEARQPQAPAPITVRARMRAGLVSAVATVFAVFNLFNWARAVRSRIVAIANSERVQRARANVVWFADKVNPMHLVNAIGNRASTTATALRARVFGASVAPTAISSRAPTAAPALPRTIRSRVARARVTVALLWNSSKNLLKAILNMVRHMRSIDLTLAGLHPRQRSVEEQPAQPAATATPTAAADQVVVSDARPRDVGRIVTGLSILGLGSFAALVAASALARTTSTQTGNTPASAQGANLEEAASTFVDLARSAHYTRP